MSVPMLIGAYPATVAAAAPELEPPVFHSGFQGLRVVPCLVDTPEVSIPKSGIVVLATSTAPASFSRAAAGASRGAGARTVACEPSGEATPVVAMFSLSVTGTPSSGLSGSPARHRSSAALAWRSASVSSRCHSALIVGSQRSIRARTALRASGGEQSPAS